MEPISKETDTVGLKISTKAVGFNRRHDLTDDYKHPEGKSYAKQVCIPVGYVPPAS